MANRLHILLPFELYFFLIREYDIANHFLEWTMDNTITEPPYFSHRPEDFPTREQQLHFIRAYLSKFPTKEGPTSEICSGKEEEGILKEVLR